MVIRLCRATRTAYPSKIPSSIGREGTMAIARDLEKMLNDSYQEWAEDVLGADVQYFSVKFEKLYERFFQEERRSDMRVYSFGKKGLTRTR